MTHRSGGISFDLKFLVFLCSFSSCYFVFLYVLLFSCVFLSMLAQILLKVKIRPGMKQSEDFRNEVHCFQNVFRKGQKRIAYSFYRTNELSKKAFHGEPGQNCPQTNPLFSKNEFL